MGDECDAAMQGPDGTGATVISLALIAGTTLSFVPQWVCLIQEKSSRGVSVFAQSFGTVGCFVQAFCAFLLVYRCGLFGGIVSHESAGAACAGMNFFSWNCQQLLLALYLTGSFVLGQAPILILVGIYFEPEVAADIVRERRFMRVAIICTCSFIAVLTLVLLGLLLFDRSYETMHVLGEVVTPLGAICMASTYLPQILTTCRLKKKGALSLLSLAIQVPGAAFVGISLILDGQSWDVVLPTCASSFTGAILLIQLIYYELKARTKRKTTLQHEFTSPLLYNVDHKQSFEVLYP